MKLDEASAELGVELVGAGGRAQRLCVDGGALVLSEGGAALRRWPLHAARVNTDLTVSAPRVETCRPFLTQY